MVYFTFFISLFIVCVPFFSTVGLPLSLSLSLELFYGQLVLVLADCVKTSAAVLATCSCFSAGFYLFLSLRLKLFYGQTVLFLAVCVKQQYW